MADKTLRVESRVEPTFWNRNITLGASIGLLSGLLFPPIGGIALLAGGIIGGFMGKARMEREAENGKDVKPPTFWNRSVINGAALGDIAAGMIGVAVVIGSAIASIPTGATPAVAHAAMQTAVQSSMGWVALGGVAGITAGGIIGGYMGKGRMEKEYKSAQEYVAQHGGEYRGRAVEESLSRQAPVPPRNYTVSQEEAALLESRLASRGGEPQSHVERVHAARGGINTLT